MGAFLAALGAVLLFILRVIGILLLVVLISALLPILRRIGLVDRSTPAKITW